MKYILTELISPIFGLPAFGQLTNATEDVEYGTLTTYFRNGTKILTDEVIHVGKETPKRRIQTQRVWIDGRVGLRIDTFMITTSRYYYLDRKTEMIELLEEKRIDFRKLRPEPNSDIHESFIVLENGMLEPLPHEDWLVECVPVTGTLSEDEPIEVGGVKFSLVNTENETVEETEASATVLSP